MITHNQQVHVLEDGSTLRMVGPNILVRIDPVPEMSSTGLIHLANSAEHVYNTGTVLAFGTREVGNHLEPLTDELEVGHKVLFVRYLAEQDSNKYLRSTIEPDVIRLKLNDILVTFPPDVNPVVSG